MLFYFSITGLINAVTSSLIGVFVYFKNTKSLINKTFALFALYVAIWGYAYIFWPLAQSKEECLYWFRMLHIGAILIPAGFYHFVAAFLGKVNKRSVFFAYIVAAFFLSFSFSKYYIVDMKPRYFIPYYGVPGLLYPFFLVMFLGYAGFSIYLLFKEYRLIEDAKRKSQILCIAIGTLVGFIGGSTNYLLWFDIPIPPYLNPLVAVYVILIAYAIVRHQLMDIEVIIKKTLVFAGLLASVLGIIVAPTLVIQEYLLRHASIPGRILGLSISGIIIIFTTRRIETFLINVTDRFLFQKRYDYKELLKTFTQDVLTILDMNKLISQTVEKLIDIIKISNASIILLEEETQKYQIVSSKGLKDDSFSISKPNSLISYFDITGGYILRTQEGPNSQFPKDIKDALNRLEAELLVPLTLHSRLIGILSIGKKKSDETYSQDDIDILLPLARTLAIAISNARLFDQLSKTQAEAAQREKMAVIGTLSAGINHEICNPLGIARGQCEAFLLNLRDGLYKDKSSEELLKKAEEIMHKVIKETDRATVITKRLSSFAKPAKGEQQVIDIKHEIDEVVDLIGYELKLEKIEITKRFDENVSDIFADKKQVQEIFFNLIRNAGQAIGERGKIILSAKNQNGKVVIDIKDTGHGIPEDKVKELFNPFFTTKEPGKGTGLGLFIVRQVVERNGGRIYLKETKVGEGTTFTIEFPAGAAVKAEARV